MRPLMQWAECDWFDRIVHLELLDTKSPEWSAFAGLSELETITWSIVNQRTLELLAAGWQQAPSVLSKRQLSVTGYQLQGRFRPNGLRWQRSRDESSSAEQANKAAQAQIVVETKPESLPIEDYLQSIRSLEACSDEPVFLCRSPADRSQ
jgi:hypothetical protein